MGSDADVSDGGGGGALAVVVAAFGLVALIGTCLGIVSAIPVAADDVAWRAYEDPSKTVTMQVPKAWRPGKQAERGAARVVTFALPDAGGELTLSITPDLRRPGELPASIVKPFFPDGASLNGPRTARGKGWLGLRQEATSTVGGKERVVVGQFYVFGSTLVAVTLADDEPRIDAYREDFERIVKSLQYHEAAIDTVQGTSTDGLRG